MAAQTLTSLPIQQLQPNPLQPRSKILKEDLDELSQSIKAYGVLEPLVVAKTPAGYQIIAGERRWRAAQLAGITEVPVVIKVATPKGMLEMALIENVQRVDLSAIERAQAFQQLIREFRYTHQQLGEKIGKSSSFVSNSLRLLSLPDAIKDGMISGQISEGHARALLTIEHEKYMVECFKRVVKENASVRRTEELARYYKELALTELGGGFPTRSATSAIIRTPEIESWQKALQTSFGKQSKVKLLRSARQTKVMFVFKGTPEDTQNQLNKLLELAHPEE